MPKGPQQPREDPKGPAQPRPKERPRPGYEPGDPLTPSKKK